MERTVLMWSLPEKLQECRGDQTALSMKQVWMTLHSVALEDRIRSINTHAPIIWTNFCKVDSKALLTEHVSLLWRTCWEKNPSVLQSDGTDHVYDNTVSSVSWSFSRACVERQ